MKKLFLMIGLSVLSYSLQANTKTEGGKIKLENTAQKIEIPVSVLPNPVIETGEIQFTLQKDAKQVFIFIANASGKIVSSLPVGETKAGVNQLILNVDGLKGIYVVGVQAGNQSGTCKMYVR